MFVGTVNKGISVAGYLRDNLLEPASLAKRHHELALEMSKRGYKHKSPLPLIELELIYNSGGNVWDIEIDKEAALKELLRRCPDCAARHVATIEK
jgi:hypothetical protein